MSELRPYGVALTATSGFYLNHPKYATPTDFAVAADWTPAAGDVKVSKDGGSANNIATLPTYVVDKGWYYTFSASELTCQQLVVRIADAATKVIVDDSFVVETYGNASAMHPDPTDAAPVYAQLNAATLALVASQASVDTVDNFIDTEVAAIKAKTDLIPAAPAAVADIPTAAANAAALLAVPLVEPTAVPAVTATVKNALGWLLALSRNRITQTSSTTTLRNDANSADVATSAVSDDGTTFVRGEWS